MKQYAVVLIVSWLSGASASALAQDSATFSLAEVEANVAQHKAALSAPNPQQAVKQALGARRWGMSKAELLEVLKGEIQSQFEQRIKIERDIMRQDALYQESQQRYRRIQDNYVSFNGTKSGWDVSPVAREFAQNNEESMLVVQNTGARELYFFQRGKLYKWYREFAADARGDDALRTLGAQLGQGKPQQERLDEAHEPYAGVLWVVDDTRVTALKRGAEKCVIFEDKNVVARLVAQRAASAKKKAPAGGQTIDWILLPPSEEQPPSQ